MYCLFMSFREYIAAYQPAILTSNLWSSNSSENENFTIKQNFHVKDAASLRNMSLHVIMLIKFICWKRLQYYSRCSSIKCKRLLRALPKHLQCFQRLKYILKCMNQFSTLFMKLIEKLKTCKFLYFCLVIQLFACINCFSTLSMKLK